MEPERIGPYRTLTRLGSGRTGTVYLALDPEGRTVAVRVLHPRLAADTADRARLAREVATIRQVYGPHLAEVIDADVLRAAPYIVTRYVQGRSLDDIVRDRGPLSGEALLRIADGVAAALMAMHRAGVVHGDLTPRNVMVAEGQPIVIDFAVGAVGTPGYVAPEVLRGDRAGPASDVFGWAATVSFAATGRRCFPGESLTVAEHRVLYEDPDLTGVSPTLLPRLRAALAKHPADRPPARGLFGREPRPAAGRYGRPYEKRHEPAQSTPAAPATGQSTGVSTERAAQQANLRAQIDVLGAMAEAATARGDHHEAVERYTQLWQVSIDIGDRGREAHALTGLGVAALQCGDYGRARECFSRGRLVCRHVGDRGREAYALTGLGDVARGCYDYPAAQRWYEQAHRIGVEIGDRAVEAAGLNGLGETALQRGDLDEATRSFHRARQIWAAIGDRAQESFALNCSAEAALQRGDFSRAESYYEWARQIGVEIGNRGRQATALNGCGSVALQRGDLRHAEGCYERARQIWVELGDRDMEAYSLNGLGDTARLRRDVGRARECYQQARQISSEIGNGAREAYALWGLGQLACETGNRVRAQWLWRQAAEILDQTGDPFADVVRNSLSELG